MEETSDRVSQSKNLNYSSHCVVVFHSDDALHLYKILICDRFYNLIRMTKLGNQALPSPFCRYEN